MPKEHHLIITPGLGGETPLFRRIADTWRRFGFTVHIYDPHWKDTESDFSPKLHRLIKVIDQLYSKDSFLSLLGTSAGGPAVLNAFFERPGMIHRVVNAHGRLRAGVNVQPTLEVATQKSPAFLGAVQLFEKNEPMITSDQKSRILTVRALADRVVPLSTTIVHDAENRQIWSVGHVVSIAATLTIYAHSVVTFLQQDTDI